MKQLHRTNYWWQEVTWTGDKSIVREKRQVVVAKATERSSQTENFERKSPSGATAAKLATEQLEKN